MLDLRNRSIRYLSLLIDRSISIPTPVELKLVDDLRAAFRKLPAVVAPQSNPSAQEWAENMNELRWLVLNDDPRKFLRWKVILETMFTAFATYIRRELRFLKKLPDFASRWQPALMESRVGHPFFYPFYPRSSGNLIHHSYHIAQYELSTGNRIEKLSHIVEFGGGYGSMCRLIHRLGFSGKYIILDLPHFSALQEFYLRCLGFTVHNSEKIERSGIYCVSEIDQLSRLTEDVGPDSLFIATWSFSETPVYVRNAVVPILDRFSSFLFAYQEVFGEMDNRRYFDAWRATLNKAIKWYEWPIPHIPNNSYLIGTHR
jgi:hypothetical protein